MPLAVSELLQVKITRVSPHHALAGSAPSCATRPAHNQRPTSYAARHVYMSGRSHLPVRYARADRFGAALRGSTQREVPQMMIAIRTAVKKLAVRAEAHIDVGQGEREAHVRRIGEASRQQRMEGCSLWH